MATTGGIPLSKVSPAFLHANSTSHTWVFSAFAELIDNAYDPDASASELLIDKLEIGGVECLIFLDNGSGMDSEKLLKMLSFGFCEKDAYEANSSHMPIGHYGNGFKSGSMRIGADAIVFTRCQYSASIGFLSQTYLQAIKADCVQVPILTYRLPKLERIKSQEARNNLDAILKYSVFWNEAQLRAELTALERSKTGTKIIIYNLKRLQDNRLELDFSSDPSDIRCPEAHEVDLTSVYHRPVQTQVSEYKHSLREYCSILFLKPRMEITIRGSRVKSKLVSKSLSSTEVYTYKPTWLPRPVKIIFGFTCNKEKNEDYGMMLYYRNRLIKAYKKVGYQKQPNDLGVGVVGVARVDFLKPIHNKQDFIRDEKYNSVILAFANKLNDYWNEKRFNPIASEKLPGTREMLDWIWVQCDMCLKWRRLPVSFDASRLPDPWYCRMNPDLTYNRCEIDEEPEDEDLAVRPTYEKTFKKKEEEQKRRQLQERQFEEDNLEAAMAAITKKMEKKEDARRQREADSGTIDDKDNSRGEEAKESPLPENTTEKDEKLSNLCALQQTESETHNSMDVSGDAESDTHNSMDMSDDAELDTQNPNDMFSSVDFGATNAGESFDSIDIIYDKSCEASVSQNQEPSSPQHRDYSKDNENTSCVTNTTAVSQITSQEKQELIKKTSVCHVDSVVEEYQASLQSAMEGDLEEAETNEESDEREKEIEECDFSHQDDIGIMSEEGDEGEVPSTNHISKNLSFDSTKGGVSPPDPYNTPSVPASPQLDNVHSPTSVSQNQEPSSPQHRDHSKDNENTSCETNTTAVSQITSQEKQELIKKTSVCHVEVQTELLTSSTNDQSDSKIAEQKAIIEDLKEKVYELTAKLKQKNDMYDISNSRFVRFQSNVYKLLELLLEDQDLGDAENLEDLVVRMLKANTKHTSQQVQGDTPTFNTEETSSGSSTA